MGPRQSESGIDNSSCPQAGQQFVDLGDSGRQVGICAQIGHSSPRRQCTGRAGWAGGTLRSCGASCTSRAGRAYGAGRTLSTRSASGTSRAGRAYRAGRTLSTRGTSGTGGAHGTGWAGGTLRSCGASCTGRAGRAYRAAYLCTTVTFAW